MVKKRNTFPVIGIGASAGGFKVYSDFLETIPPQFNAAFILITHLDPKHKSNLTEILSKKTSLKVLTITDGLKINPKHIYVIPPTYDVLIADRKFKLCPRELVKKTIHQPINIFLSSLANTYKQYSIAVILAGEGTDGSSGIIDIKKNGGITLAQDPSTTNHCSMPKSAIDTENIDFIVQPEYLIEEIKNAIAHIGKKSDDMKTLSKNNNTDEGIWYEKLMQLLKKKLGINFSEYKKSTIKRRIQRKMLMCKKETLKEYFNFIKNNPHEVNLLTEDILIKYTSFFRDSIEYDRLREVVFPSLLKNASKNNVIRIWVPGCATGEEAYSIAISLTDYIQCHTNSVDFQIFATDVSKAAIEKARAGIYSNQIMNNIPEDYLRRFFKKCTNGYQISKSIREKCIFANQNVVTDPPFSQIDLISCRNMLIYFDTNLQKKVIPIFHYALNPFGYLWLGTSETVVGFASLFERVDNTSKIYSKINGSSNKINQDFSIVRQGNYKNYPDQDNENDLIYDEDLLLKKADKLYFSQLAPASFIVNSELQIIRFRGNTAPYLSPSLDQASLNLLSMVRVEFRIELRKLIHEVATLKETIKSDKNIYIDINGEQRAIEIEIIPISHYKFTHMIYLVVFRDFSTNMKIVRDSIHIQTTPKKIETISEENLKSESTHEIKRLKTELAELTEQFQNLIEQEESNHEELKSSNEEILSANEELQSTNEELETAKEELQSTNEEITTVNDELNSRNEELSRTLDDLFNILNSTKYPMILVGGDLRLRRFNDYANKIFRVIPTDIGRNISDIKTQIPVDNLKQIILSVIDRVQLEVLEVEQEGTYWSLQFIPYRTQENKIDGIILVAFDVTDRKQKEIIKNEALELYQNIVNTVSQPLLVLDEQFKIESTNNSFCKTFNIELNSIKGQNFFKINNGQWNIKDLKKSLEDIINDKKQFHEFEISRIFEHVGKKNLRLNASELTQQTIQPRQILLVIEDLTDKKKKEEIELKASQLALRIVDTIKTPIMVLNRNLDIIAVNKSYHDTYQTTEDDIRGENLFETGDHQWNNRNLKKMLKGGFLDSIQGRSAEISYVKKNGNLGCSFVYGCDLNFLVNGQESILLALEDISSAKEFERNLITARDLAQFASDAKTSFLANISHEIRSPLTSIVGFSELIYSDFLQNKENISSNSLDAAERIKRNSIHLMNLIDDILDISKIESGKMVSEKIYFSFVKFIKDIYINYKEKVNKKGLDFQLFFDSPCPENVCSDPTRLRQILNNLLDNAIKFTEKGSITLTVKVLNESKSDKQLSKLQFSISDTGIGIAKEKTKKLFTPFMQADSSIRREFGGTGLGLSLSRSLAKNLGGDVILSESSQGKGSTFIATVNIGNTKNLNLIEKINIDELWHQKDEGLKIIRKNLLRGVKILIVDDSADIRKLLERFLGKILGASLEFANNGNEGVLKAQTQEFDLVLMDLHMPVMDGYEATSVLRKSGFLKPIIAVTARVFAKELEKGQLVGINEYISKPIEMDNLLRIIQKYCHCTDT